MNKKQKNKIAIKQQFPTGILVLDNKLVFRGIGLGYQGTSTGEVCFNTSLTGYQEIISDPSYAGQIINFTFPHIGNVGTNNEDLESDKVWTKGAIFNSEITSPSNYRALRTLDEWLKKNKIVGLTGLDTRSLTNFKYKKNYTRPTKSLRSTQNYYNETKSLTAIDIKEFSFLYILLKKPGLIKENFNLIENVKLFSSENKLLLEEIVNQTNNFENTDIENLKIDQGLIERVFKYASIKHILFKSLNDDQKILEILSELIRDLKNYELELRIADLESRFTKDLSEATFNELKELKKLQKIN